MHQGHSWLAPAEIQRENRPKWEEIFSQTCIFAPTLIICRVKQLAVFRRCARRRFPKFLTAAFCSTLARCSACGLGCSFPTRRVGAQRLGPISLALQSVTTHSGLHHHHATLLSGLNLNSYASLLYLKKFEFVISIFFSSERAQKFLNSHIPQAISPLGELWLTLPSGSATTSASPLKQQQPRPIPTRPIGT